MSLTPRLLLSYVKMQIPLKSYGCTEFLVLLSDKRSLRFGALTSVGALFYFYKIFDKFNNVCYTNKAKRIEYYRKKA